MNKSAFHCIAGDNEPILLIVTPALEDRSRYSILHKAGRSHDHTRASLLEVALLHVADVGELKGVRDIR